MSNNITPPLL